MNKSKVPFDEDTVAVEIAYLRPLPLRRDKDKCDKQN
jgi:hypothetical protein